MLHQIAWPPPGKYVLAVSGGLDSMTLLHLMGQRRASSGYELVVGHFDHGLRADSPADARLVEAAARSLGFEFALGQGRLGTASEAEARQSRYEFLEQVALRHHATAVVTAHHQDDLIETSLLNLARGSGRAGLAPMSSRLGVVRPLLSVSRTKLHEYAVAHGIEWREDSTNQDLSNPRNFLRQRLLPAADVPWRTAYLGLIQQLGNLNVGIDRAVSQALAEALTEQSTGLCKNCLKIAIIRQSGEPPAANPSEAEIRLSCPDHHSLAELAEVIRQAAHRLEPGIELSERLLQELALFTKVAAPGKRRSVSPRLWLELPQR